MSDFDNTPIIVGVGQQTWREPDASRTPIDAITEVSALALTDAGSGGVKEAIDAVATVRFVADTDPGTGALFPRNPGKHAAQRLGISNATFYQGVIGGNTPQYLVNHFADKLVKGEHSAVLISGAELLATMFSAFKTGGDISAWAGEQEPEPTTLGVERDGLNDTEKQYSLYEPINTYPLFESSLRRHLGRSHEEHQAILAELCSGMSRVAAENPVAWSPKALTAQEISTVSEKNRYIGYPYTKAMNPVLAVDMGAAVVMTTVGKARELGIDPRQWIYVRGGIDVNDTWHISERPCLHESPAIRLAWRRLCDETGIDLDTVTDFDIYSCFPSAVEVACNEIGLSISDPRGVTVTGGLPYMGGPGNNYSLHAIAAMTARLRERGNGHGLVTANGLYLTKHSLGLYSTEPSGTEWKALDSGVLQQQVDNLPTLSIATDPVGAATAEAFTVSFDRNGPKQGIVIAKNDAGDRILAYTPSDAEILKQLLDEDVAGRAGQVSVVEGVNIFKLQ
ncbi:MAG: acetyl-CoA acetyltransferase [Halioglobus sp.]